MTNVDPDAHAPAPPLAAGAAEAPAPWSHADVERRCGVLREQLAGGAADVVSEAELAAAWPGGSGNELPAPAAWWYCWGTYVAFARRMERAARAATADADLRAAIARRSAREVERVRLSDGRTVAVHPKSYWTLRFLDFLDHELRLAAQIGRAWLDDLSPEGQRLIALTPLLEATAVRVWAWILMHPGPALPFEDGDVELEPPPETAALSVTDILALWRAHQRLHAEDLRLISEAFPGSDGPTRLGIEGFLSTYVEGGGYLAFDVFRRFSLGEIYANAVARAQALQEARARRTPPGGTELPAELVGA